MPTSASFIVYFRSFQTNIFTIFTTNICDKMSIRIWCQDSNPRPSEHESPPIVTGPRLLVGIFSGEPFKTLYDRKLRPYSLSDLKIATVLRLYRRNFRLESVYKFITVAVRPLLCFEKIKIKKLLQQEWRMIKNDKHLSLFYYLCSLFLCRLKCFMPV